MKALYEVSTERAEFYRCRPSEGLMVPILVRQSDIEDGIPTGTEVETAVKGMKGGRVGGPSLMRIEDLNGWIQEAKRKKEPVRRRWELLVRLVQQKFEDGTPPEELVWATMVLILKGKGG